MSKAFADPRDANYIASANQPHAAALASDYTALGIQLERRGIKIDEITQRRRQIQGGRSLLGRRHGRHALRPLSRDRASRATCSRSSRTARSSTS